MNDLRSGSLRIQVHEQGREAQSDRLGRRVFSATVVGSSILGCAVLLAGDHVAGAVLFALFGAIWTGGHVVLSRRRREQ